MIRGLIFILLIGGISFFFTDLESESALRSVVLPLIDFLALVALMWWFVALFNKLGVKQTSDIGGGDVNIHLGGMDGSDGGGDG